MQVDIGHQVVDSMIDEIGAWKIIAIVVVFLITTVVAGMAFAVKAMRRKLK